jgi:hypothetical protein
VVNEEDFDKAKVKLPRIERLSYENRRKRGYDGGWSDGFDGTIEDYRITYPCRILGKPVEMLSGDNDDKAMVDYMKEHGRQHGKCSS